MAFKWLLSNILSTSKVFWFCFFQASSACNFKMKYRASFTDTFMMRLHGLERLLVCGKCLKITISGNMTDTTKIVVTQSVFRGICAKNLLSQHDTSSTTLVI